MDVCGGPGYFSDGSFITARWGHPHSTYAQGRRGGVKSIAYDCVQGGMGEECSGLRAYTNFFLDHNISRLFLYKRSYYIVIYYCV